jgi:hypothetical protein
MALGVISPPGRELGVSTDGLLRKTVLNRVMAPRELVALPQSSPDKIVDVNCD